MAEPLYDRLIAEVFRRHKGAEQQEFEFVREEMADILREWGERVRNLGDVVYSYRGGRRPLPAEITVTGNWIIEGRGTGRYAFRRLEVSPYITLPSHLHAIDIPDATPEIIVKYGGSDEQGLLTRVRYNRLVDTFLAITAYHVQGHIRTFLPGSGQVEIDDLYLGIDTDGRQYVIPVEAKSAREPLGVVQIASQNAYARRVYPNLTLKSVAVKASPDGSIFFLSLSDAVEGENIEILDTRRYRLVRETEPELGGEGEREAADG